MQGRSLAIRNSVFRGGFWPLRLEITVGDCDAIGKFFEEELEGSDVVPEDKEYLLNE